MLECFWLDVGRAGCYNGGVKQDTLNKIAIAAGYMILCDDPAYLPFWVKPNGDMVKPADQPKEVRRLCLDILFPDIQPYQRNVLMALLDL
jgi:hypothetical protein